jgi:hypothetical protein
MDLNKLSENPEQIHQLISLLKQLLPKDGEEDIETKEDFVSPIKTRGSRKIQKGQRPNKFVDMPEKNMHKDDSAVDKILSKMPPVARSREFTPVQVKCRICGETEEVSPSLITSDSKNRYKCNKCSTSAG